ncbi:MAG TPA: bacillithiol biosynthesis cysteine-adding enzyme BshC [Gemmatimonadales bacterium]|nr:bacillithiol biosynthesis cysteine-adding enzyme BshC [Gemmatimonadales bacterium]
MTLRIVTTPLDTPPAWPAERTGGLDPALLDALVPAPGTEALVAKLRDPKALVVTTGQQPGLFTGPLYTIHKALSAKALAELLEARWQRPVVPLFWLAGDDHDFAEARTAAWLRSDGSVATGSLLPRPADAAQLPMYRTLLGPEIDSLVEGLAADLRPQQHSAWTEAWIRNHWNFGRTIGAAYAGALAELLGPAGILCFDPTHRSAKRVMARHLIKALGLARDLDRDLDARAKELAAAGHDGGVVVGDGATLVMLEGTAGRDRLVLDGDGFVTRRSEERFTLDQLTAIAAEDPERLSPNVLLRPVVEAAILPTVSYVAGPGELNYWRLTSPIFSRMRVEPQAALPRWSGMIIEPGVDRLLADLGVTLDDLLAPGGALERRLALGQLPEAAARSLGELRADLEREFGILAASGAGIAPQLGRSVETLRRRIEWLVGRTESKFVAHLKRRNEETTSRILRARGSLRPENRPQERVLTAAPFLARHGTGILGELGVVIRGWYRAALEGAGPTP